MSLDNYNNLAKHSLTELGVQLPELISAKLEIKSEQGDFSLLNDKVSLLKPTAGWVMYRNRVDLYNKVTSSNAFEHHAQGSEVLEAEFTDGEKSIKIKHIYADQYQITTFANTADKNANFCYSEQDIFVRNKLKGKAKTARYRLWYENIDHRWQPIAQHFIGFDCEEKK